jgi:hypothetical protein
VHLGPAAPFFLEVGVLREPYASREADLELDERRDRLERLAEAISDRIPVDWELAAQMDPENSDSFDALKTLEALAAVHVPAPAPSAVQRTWGPLEIRAKIGEGAFGEVYRAFDPALEVEVALKLVHGGRAGNERSTLRFLEEARKLAKVRHPNVLVVHGVETHQDRAGMWTELVRGKTLEQRVKEGRLGAREAALIGIDLCKAIAAVHAAGLIHRDVKTHNVMQEEGGRIVLMDFGSAGVFSPDATPRGEGAYGTPLTVAPEVLRGQPAEPATDLYSLGVLLYRLVTGRYPVEAATLPALMQQHEGRAPMPLRERRPDLPSQFVQLVERAIDPDPSRRFPGPGAFESALARFLNPAPEPGTFSRVLDWFRSRPIRIAYVGAPAVAVAVAIFVVFFAGHKPETGPGALTANAMLYRQRGGAAEPLMHGGRVSPGDTLYMELEGAESMNVYVLDEDQTGKVYVLFPLPGVDVSNPLPANSKHRLPGTRNGVPENWLVTSAGGSEDVSVIASRKPLEEVEAQLASMPRAEPGAPVLYTELSGKALQQTAKEITRGIGGTVQEEPPVGQQTMSISDIVGRLASQPEHGRDIWVWQTRLSNPLPTK